MNRRPYGSTGLELTVLTYGAMTIALDPGVKVKVAPSLLAALEAGVNLVDTARVYENSEELVDATLAAWDGPPPLISTKVRSLARDAYRFGCPVAEAYQAEAIRESVETSLKALRRETLDIVHLHQWHYGCTHDLSSLETLHTL